jgi:aryl-alcohol dehydrogenase-like predicted oxidoreductase
MVGRAVQAAIGLPSVERFVSSQPQYSMLWRRPEEEVYPLCAANGISQIVWSPLDQGVLTGKYDPDAPPPREHGQPARKWAASWTGSCKRPVLEAVQELKPLAASAGLSLAQFALAWVLREPTWLPPSLAPPRPEQVEENAAASGAEVDPALFGRRSASSRRLG